MFIMCAKTGQSCFLFFGKDDPVSPFPISFEAVSFQDLPDPVIDLGYLSLEIGSGHPECVIAQNDHLFQPV